MRLLLLLSLTLALAGCGQRGPLYLPEEPAATPVAGTEEAAAGSPAARGEQEAADEDEDEREGDDASAP